MVQQLTPVTSDTEYDIIYPESDGKPMADKGSQSPTAGFPPAARLHRKASTPKILSIMLLINNIFDFIDKMRLPYELYYNCLVLVF